MAFIDVSFPTEVSGGSDGGPEYSTAIIPLVSGLEVSNSLWSYPRHSFEAAVGVRSMADIEAVLRLFHVCRGRANSFRFKDWADYKSCSVLSDEAETDQEIGTGDNNEVDFQLIKTYSFGGVDSTRIITKPVAGTVIAAINGTPTSAFTLDTDTGIITFTTPPGAGLSVTAGYEFDCHCRFDTDTMSTNLNSYKLGSTSIPVVELKSTE